MLRAKLARLNHWNAAWRAAAARYDELLADLDVVRPVTADGNVHVWHMWCGCPRDGLRPGASRVLAELNEQGIGAGIHYPIPVHLTPAFAHLGYGRRGPSPRPSAPPTRSCRCRCSPRSRRINRNVVNALRHAVVGSGPSHSVTLRDRTGSRTASPSSVQAGVRPGSSSIVILLGVVSLLTDISSEMVRRRPPLYLTAEIGLGLLAYGFVDGVYQEC